jgi:hypothetical protein
LLAGAGTAEARRRHRTRGVDARPAASPEDVIGYLRANEITLTYDQAAETVRAGATGAAKASQEKHVKSRLEGLYREEEEHRRSPGGAAARARVTIRHARKRAAARLGLRAISACSGVWRLVLIGASAQAGQLRTSFVCLKNP